MNPKMPQPIPIPLLQRFHQARVLVLPWMVFLGAIFAIALLWKDRVAAPTLVGQAEGIFANVSSHRSGVLAGVSVNRFQKVHAGERIASVLIADPKLVEASLAVIRTEIEMMRANLNPIAAQQRNAVNYAQLRLDWMRQRAELATARVNAQLAEAEFNRSQELFKNKIASQSELDSAKTAFDVLQKQIEELSQLVAEGEQSFVNLQPANTGDIARISDEPMRTAIAAQEAKLRLTEAELSPVQLYAPIDGTVTAVHFRSGESITPGQPIVTITADTATRIIGYLREPIRAEVKAGDTVEVRTRRVHRETATATVLDLSGQLEALPLSLQSAIKLAGTEMALPINISLPDKLSLRPGEMVDIRLVSALD